MIEVKVDASGLGQYRAAFGATWAKGLERAVKAELYRLLLELRKATRPGFGAQRSPLAAGVSKYRHRRALSYVAKVAAYEYRQKGDDFEGLVGPSAQAARRRRAVPLGLLSYAVGPGSQVVTPETQRAIAGRLRKMRRLDLLGEGPKRRAAKIPRQGSTLVTPGRHYAEAVEKAQGTKSADNIAKLLSMALRGERWAGKWWEQ